MSECWIHIQTFTNGHQSLETPNFSVQVDGPYIHFLFQLLYNGMTSPHGKGHLSTSQLPGNQQLTNSVFKMPSFTVHHWSPFLFDFSLILRVFYCVFITWLSSTLILRNILNHNGTTFDVSKLYDSFITNDLSCHLLHNKIFYLYTHC